MDEEDDIGLTNLSSRSFGTAMHTPPRRSRPSLIKISRHSSTHSPLKSPSSPSLSKDFQSGAASSRRLSRSNTLPKLATEHGEFSLETFGLENLAMGNDKVVKLRRWIHALAIVDFDLEYGPKITKLYPALILSPSESENVAFLSFPDAPQTEEGSYLHSFRIRHNNPGEDKLLRSDGDRPHSVDGFVYGFSHFTQRRDSSSKQVACHNIANWPDPLPGSTIELGFLGSVFNAELPGSVDSPQAQGAIVTLNDYDQETRIFASVPPPHPPIIAAFEACMPHLWSIWECLVLCEPILVYGPSAAMVSQAIWWLRDILRPIPLTGDFRPFLTIHDVDYTTFVNPRLPQSGVILGVTNPLIERACKHWPHIVSLGSSRSNKAQTPRTPRTPWTPVDMSSVFSAGPAPGWKSKTHKRYISRDQALLKRCQEACVRGDLRAKIEASNALRQHFSQRTTALLVPLQRYLNTLIPTPSESATVANFPAFPSLSTSSLATSGSASLLPPSPSSVAPTSSSTSSLTTDPASSSSSPVNARPPTSTSLTRLHTPSPQIPHHSGLRLKAFSTAAFLASLSRSSSSATPHPPSVLPFKSTSKQKEFYERWLRTRAFGVWIGEQEEVVKGVLEKRVYEL
ncbi:unnamed protein product [Somion occarium]|uniref:UDENN domain-containing protein n=1 Tax=Somion occarium TaxID=3059160 RepID=A0ABP1E8P5_9APHY